MQKANETVLEINLDALGNNYRYLTSKLKKETKVLTVVKAFGYGSDSVAVANELATLGADYFAVAYSSEGETLRNAGVKTPILVFHTLQTHFDTIINRCLEPNLYSKKILKDFITVAEKHQQTAYPIHLKFNTGLNRLGFIKEDISFIAEELSKTKSVKVKSVFSHLVASNDKNEAEFTKKQIEDFRNISEELIEKIGYKPLLHMVNTSGIINYPEAQFDMVRAGIGLYGFANDKEENKNLQPVAILKTIISQIHNISPGESVGYNRGFIAKEATKTATLPIGHADGISRAYGNGKGWVSIHGKKAFILGNVCMDMIMVDVTHIDCDEGDEVIVFGDNPTANELSATINSIPYELLTSISQRIKRVVLEKAK